MTSRHLGGVRARSPVAALGIDECDTDPSPSRARRKDAASEGEGAGRRVRTRLLRIRFSVEVIERLDGLAEELKRDLLRGIARAALARALVVTNMDAVESREGIVKHLTEDPVRRGRARMGGQRRRGEKHR